MLYKSLFALMALAAMLTLSGCPTSTSKKDTNKPTASVPNGDGNLAGTNTQAPVKAITQPTEYTPAQVHGAADDPAKTPEVKPADAKGADPKSAPGKSGDKEQESAVASVIGRDTNSANTGKVTTVVLETSKGDIAIDVHEKWAPQAYLQFLQLVNVGYYDGAPWYRVISGFAAQSGISPIPAVNDKWKLNKIMDDTRVKANIPMTVCFTQNGPRSRATNFFINLSDNTSVLDEKTVPFGIVTAGMELAQQLSPISDDAFKKAGLSVAKLSGPGGIEAFKTAFPQADYIKRAYVLSEKTTTTADKIHAH